MVPEFIEDVKQTIRSCIPASAEIIGEVIRTLCDQSSSAKDLAEIIERDPLITVKIIKVANSAYYASSSEINSIQRAIVILGFDTIKELVTTIVTVHYFFNPHSDLGVDRTGLWLHSVGTAKAAQLVAEKVQYDRTDVVYTTALLHDIGKLVLAILYPDYYHDIIKLAAKKNMHIILAERKILNADHCMIGKLLCDIWNLPKHVTAAMCFHHEPMETPIESQALAQFINIGDYMCRKAQLGNPGDTLVTKPTESVFRILGNNLQENSERFDQIFQEFEESKDDIVGFFTRLG